MKKIILCLIVILSHNSISAQQLNVQKLDSLFDILSINNKTMGSVEIIKNKNIVYKKAIGFSEINESKNTLINDKTLFRIGSTTKMLTAIIVFQLIEEGKISLDTKLESFFPEVPNSDKISISTLLKHRSGLYDYVNDTENNEWLKIPQKEKTILDTIVNGINHFEPETSFSYSNSGYYLLTKIIEKTEKKDFSSVLKKRIIKKLKLKNTYSSKNNFISKLESKSYSFDNKWIPISDFYFPNVIGVGDVVSNTSDLNLIIKALFEGKLISNSSLLMMKNIGEGGFGMGLMKTPFKKHSGFGHGGDTAGTHSIVTYFPEDDLSLAIIINGQVMSRNEIGLAVLKICFNEKYILPDFKKVFVEDSKLEMYSGVYSNSKIPIKFNIYKNNNNLYAQATDQESIIIEPIDQTSFQNESLNAIFNFNIEKRELNFKQGGINLTFKKE